MARKGSNQTGRQQQRQTKSVSKQAKDDTHKHGKHPSRLIVENKFWEEFDGWRGIQVEYPTHRNGVYFEATYYLDELDEPVLFQTKLDNMLKKLVKDEKIEWYQAERQYAEWSEDVEFIRVKTK
jgi:hypothetical protein